MSKLPLGTAETGWQSHTKHMSTSINALPPKKNLKYWDEAEIFGKIHGFIKDFPCPLKSPSGT